MNYEFDLQKWLPLFQLQEVHGSYSGEDITGPCDICHDELLRRGMVDEYDWGEPTPMDIFVMSEGEPENRYATKIGGLPYRPANARWPSKMWGRPLSLIAQFNFTNSQDIVGELPGDLLLIFGDTSDEMVKPLHTEWQNIGIPNLVQADEIPPECLSVPPCFGNRCRMMSYPDAVRKSTSKYPKCHGKDVWTSKCIPQLQATQIGRAPYFIQEHDSKLPGQPLCTISSVQPDLHRSYPWVNVPEPLFPPNVWNFSEKYLMIGDLGCIYIFMDNRGKLHMSESCY